MGTFKRNGNWWIDYYDQDGRRRRKRIGPDKRTAVAVERSIKAGIAKGEFLGLTEDKTTFSEFTATYQKIYVGTNLSPTTRARCRGIIMNWLIPHFGDKLLGTIRRQDIEEFRSNRASLVKPATANREFSRLRHIFGRAVAWGI